MPPAPPTQETFDRVRRARRKKPAPLLTRPSDRPAGVGPSAPPRPASTRDGYDWGDGRGGHSITLEQHKKNAAAKSADRNPLFNPTQQLSGNSLKTAAQDLVNLEYGPQRSALQRELGNVTTQSTALAQRGQDYYAQLGQTDAGLGGQVASIGELLKGSISANAQGARSAIDSTAQDANTRAATDANLRGGVGAGLIQQAVSGETAGQQGRVTENEQASRDAAASQTANFGQLAALSASARQQMGQETQQGLLTRLANNQGEVRSQQTDLAGQEGAALTEKLLGLRQQGFENLVTQKGLDIKSSELEAETLEGKAKLAEQEKARRARTNTAAANRTLRRELDSKARADKQNAVNSIGISNKDWLKMTTSQRQKAVLDYKKREKQATTTPKDAPQMSAAAQTKMNRINSITTDIGNDPKLIRRRYQTGPRLVQILVKRGADPLEAQAAAEIARYGVLKSGTLQKLEDAGITIPTRWKGTAATGRDRQPG